MEITEKKLENSSVELSVELPIDKVDAEYKIVFNNIQKVSKFDGFRKGKAPLSMVEAKYATTASQEVAENLVKKSFYEAITEKKLIPINEPSYTIKNVEKGEVFSYLATFEVPPTVELGDYKGIKVDEKVCELTDADTDKEINALREQHATYNKKDEDAVVENGNMANINLKRADESETNAAGREYPLIIGKDEDEFSLDKHIVGMKAGEKKEIDVDYPKDYRMEELAGKKISYTIEVLGVSDVELPELNDELAGKANFDSVEKLKETTVKNLEKFVFDRTTGMARAKIIEKIIENTTFDIPESMITNETAHIFKKTTERIGYPIEDMDQFATLVGMEPSEFKAKLRADAFGSVKTTLILNEISKVEKMEVPEDKYKEVLQSIVETSKMSMEEVESLVEKNNSKQNIEQEVLFDMAMEYIYENAKVEKLKSISFDELIKEQV